MDPKIFFPERGQPSEPAKALCRECDVREDCLDHSFTFNERSGIWGGLSERQRRGLRTIRDSEKHQVRLA